MAIQPIRLTYDDYLLFPEDGLRHELLDGEHYATAAPFLRHQVIVRRFTSALNPFIEANELGELYPAPVDVILSRYDIVQPDLVFVSRERLHILNDRNIQGAPDLVIEILSESTQRRDKGIKMTTYERFGVLEYWLADPTQSTLTVYRLEGERFRKVSELSARAGDVLMTPLLPGLEIRSAEMFG